MDIVILEHRLVRIVRRELRFKQRVKMTEYEVDTHRGINLISNPFGLMHMDDIFKDVDIEYYFDRAKRYYIFTTKPTTKKIIIST